MNATRVVVAVGALIALVIGGWLVRPLFVDEVVDEEFPLSAGAVVPDDMTQEEVEAEMAAAAADTTEQAEPMPGDSPVALLAGDVTGADSFHAGEGSATLYELADGSRVLRLEDFMVTNGPDLRVYLGPLGDDGEPDLEEASVQLGPLKGNVGNQNYDVPDTLDAGSSLALVIYCEPFAVTFATAVLA